jgi:hypothetical protein
VDDPPVAVDDTLSIAEDTEGTVSVLANDSDVEEDRLRLESVTDPAHGTAEVKGHDTITYTPDENYFGGDSFLYTVTANGQRDTASVTVTVSPVNDAPVLTIDAIPLGQDMAEHSVAEIIPDDAITDLDGEATKAMAVTAVDNKGFGTWQYSTDNRVTWRDLSVDIEDGSRALLLDSNSWIRFVPIGTPGEAVPSYIFLAWDRSSGSVGDIADISAIGDPTAFSINEAEVTVVAIIQ